MLRQSAILTAALGVFAAAPASAEKAEAIFAGGCFWCMEPPFEKLDGVREAYSGYIGGHVRRPSYKEVVDGDTGHYEAVRVVYDPNVIGYAELLDVFWRNIDPFDAEGQFCDKGPQYRAAIFPQNEEERRLAEASLERVETELGRPVATDIIEADRFYDAERYHQDFYKKKRITYSFYRARCGRDDRLEEVWGEKAES